MNKESYIISCIRRLREYGEGIVLADQAISSLLDVVKANVYTTVCLSQTSQRDRREVIGVLGLNSQQAEITNFLETGQGIIRLAGRYPFAQLLNFPFVKPKNISEKELDEINVRDARVRNLLNTVKFANESFQVVPGFISEIKSSKIKKEKSSRVEITDKMKEFLMAIIPNQYKKTATEIYKLAGFSAGTGSRIAKSCVQKNLVKMIKVEFGRGNPKYPVLTPEAYKVLGISEKKFYGKGAGHEHILYQHLIAENFNEMKPVIELYRNGKSIDVAIDTNDLFVCIEVAMTSVHEKVNIEKDFALGKADYVIVACKNEKVLVEVGKKILDLPEVILKKTIICLVSDLLKRGSEEILRILKELA